MRGLSLCSGVGMMDLAAELAGIEIVLQCELDPHCRAILTKHWPDVPKIADIHDVRGDEVGTIDVVLGGIPCQPFSSNGKRLGMQDDRYLWPEAYRIIKKMRPRWVCIENVDDFINVAFDTVASDLEALHYEVWAVVLPACAVGAPHVRERAFIVAYANDSVSKWNTQQEVGWQQISSPSQLRRNIDRCSYMPVGVEHTNSSRRQGDGITTISGETRRTCGRSGEGRQSRLPESRLGRDVDGIASRLDRSGRWPAYRNQEQYEWEPPRVVMQKKANHAKRLKALGNGVVVPLMAEIFAAILAQEVA